MASASEDISSGTRLLLRTQAEVMADIDALFDRGFISFEDDGQILRSPNISAQALSSLGCDTSTKIKVAPRHAPYLAYHRDTIFAPGATEAQPAKTAPRKP